MLKVINKLNGVNASYKLSEVLNIKYLTMKDLLKSGDYDDSANYKKSEVFMQINFKDGQEATFPTSTWYIEF